MIEQDKIKIKKFIKKCHEIPFPIVTYSKAVGAVFFYNFFNKIIKNCNKNRVSNVVVEMKKHLQEIYGISDMKLKAIRLNEME